MVQRLKNTYHLLLAIFANSINGFPARKLRVIGVTGTDGKTTTTSLIYHILSTAGKNTAMISTVFAKIGDQVFDTGLHTTTPPSLFVQRMLKKSLKSKTEYLVLETTSHALDQNRVWGIPFEIGVLTNITHEHLDYHKTYEHYVKTKARLLLGAKKSFINRDDVSYPYLLALFKKSNYTAFETYGLSKEANYSMDISAKIGMPLPEFNKYNFLVAYLVCRELGISEQDIIRAIQSFVLPRGRIQESEVNGVHTVIDFAHTPNAIEKILAYVKEKHPKSNIIHIFGSAGLRDVTKRPLMGQSSGRYANLSIITEEDYRTEDVMVISKQIAEGLEREGFHEEQSEVIEKVLSKVYTIIPDREKAIEKAVSLAKKGDVIIVTGKGHEESLARGKKEYPWNDDQVLTSMLSSNH